MDIYANGAYDFSDFGYDIVQCDHKKLGDKNLRKDIDALWNADIELKSLYSDSADGNNGSETDKNLRMLYKYWDYGRIWCVTEGSGFVRTTYGDFDLEEGKAYYIRQSTLIETRCEKYMEQYYVDFLPYTKFLPLENYFCFKTVSEDFDVILGLTKKLISIHNSQRIDAIFERNSIMNAILSLFIDKPKTYKEKSPEIIKTIETINGKIKENISVSDLAASLGYNVNYFSRLFKSHIGVSPQKYIIDKRLELAKHLLLTTNMSVGEIAAESGYNDAMYFSRLFSKETGISPAFFKKKFGK